MTINEALAFLEQVTAQVQANRQVHNQIMQALRVINQYILDVEAKKQPK